MRPKLILVGVLLAALLTAGCGSDASGESEVERVVTSLDTAADGEAEGGRALESMAVATELDGLSSSSERLIIKDAYLVLVVQDAESALEQVNALVDEVDGFVVTAQMYQSDGAVNASATIRVPAEALDSVLARLRDLALEVRSQSISGLDVTEEYTDLQARLRHLEATEAQLLALMAEAEDTEATLAVFSELQRVQGDIERVKGRLQYLEQSSALSTVSIELIPDELAQPLSVAGWRPEGTLRSAVEALIRTLQFLLNALIWVVIFVLPVTLLVFGLPLAVFIWVLRRQRRSRS